LPPVSMTPLVDLPPVSITQVANNGNSFRLLHLKVNLKKKFIYMHVNSTTQRCPNTSPQIFDKKFITALMGYSGAWEKLIHGKPKVKNVVALSLYTKLQLLRL
jgi:hypothetical protein